MSPAPTKESILLQRLRAYYTDRLCRVQTCHYKMPNGMLVEDIELECPRDALALATIQQQRKEQAG